MKIAELQLWYAKRKADELHEKYKERFFVVPDEKDKLIIINRKSFRGYKRRGQINKEVRMFDIIRECFYMTPTRDSDKIVEKKSDEVPTDVKAMIPKTVKGTISQGKKDPNKMSMSEYWRVLIIALNYRKPKRYKQYLVLWMSAYLIVD